MDWCWWNENWQGNTEVLGDEPAPRVLASNLRHSVICLLPHLLRVYQNSVRTSIVIPLPLPMTLEDESCSCGVDWAVELLSDREFGKQLKLLSSLRKIIRSIWPVSDGI